MHLPSSAATSEADLLPVALLVWLYVLQVNNHLLDPDCGYHLLQQAGYKYAGVSVPMYTCKGNTPDIR